MTDRSPDPARPRRRRWLARLMAAVVVLAGSYAALWFWAEHALDRAFAEWAAASRAKGWTVSFSPPQRGSWPFAATLIVPDLALSGAEPDIPGGLAWQAGRVVIEWSPLDPRAVVIEPAGAQLLRLSTAPEIAYDADALRAAVKLSPGVPPRGAEIRALNLRAGPQGRAGGGITVGSLALNVRWPAEAGPAEPVLSLDARARDVALPATANWPLGSRMADISADATVTGQMPPLAGLAERAAAWRDAGGSLRAERFTLTWGSLNLSGSATIGLDNKLQPVGSGTARVADPSETLNALVTHGAITRRAAFAASAVLALLERPSDGGGTPVVELPVSLKDRVVSVGNVPLAKVPTLVWPEMP